MRGFSFVEYNLFVSFALEVHWMVLLSTHTCMCEYIIIITLAHNYYCISIHFINFVGI